MTVFVIQTQLEKMKLFSATLTHPPFLTPMPSQNTGIIYDDVSGLQNVIECRGPLPFLQTQLLQSEGTIFIHMFNCY